MSPLCSLLHSDLVWLIVVAFSCDGEGLKSNWLILVLKAGSGVSSDSSVSTTGESFTLILV